VYTMSVSSRRPTEGTRWSRTLFGLPRRELNERRTRFVPSLSRLRIDKRVETVGNAIQIGVEDVPVLREAESCARVAAGFSVGRTDASQRADHSSTRILPSAGSVHSPRSFRASVDARNRSASILRAKLLDRSRPFGATYRATQGCGRPGFFWTWATASASRRRPGERVSRCAGVEQRPYALVVGRRRRGPCFGQTGQLLSSAGLSSLDDETHG
jgi:hypothetical protein